eukprot:CAMPEP_0119110864 /NCGR_PEP_ID=MMETSP1180-20130426/32591_1 /TAXON_ID=3052 ORGANISM="Chlamydomonas cf sp, Strain CCMP681" /NCGR_SAMPLE_ID=MMETSP1180 /ASSEMBLY_ACC=CAM_ASM_000741 /LENGTH=98 /DNA_ID=CAMNT_0007097489 /DNA_START=499 /DNA_END=795 /DNA_ORIENTATION=+
MTNYGRQSLQRSQISGDRQIHLFNTKVRILAADTDIARGDKIHPTTDALTMNSCNDRPPTCLQRSEGVLKSQNVFPEVFPHSSRAGEGFQLDYHVLEV